MGNYRPVTVTVFDDDLKALARRMGVATDEKALDRVRLALIQAWQVTVRSGALDEAVRAELRRSETVRA